MKRKVTQVVVDPEALLRRVQDTRARVERRRQWMQDPATMAVDALQVVEEQPGPLGLQEFADLVGISYASVRSYHCRGLLPEPNGYVGKTPFWSVEQAIIWRVATPPPGRGRFADLSPDELAAVEDELFTGVNGEVQGVQLRPGPSDGCGGRPSAPVEAPAPLVAGRSELEPPAVPASSTGFDAEALARTAAPGVEGVIPDPGVGG